MVVRTDETLKLLDEAAETTPFARLLATAGPRRLAHAAQPGHPFAAAVLARALDAPVLALAADPRSADDVVATAAAFLGPDRVLRFPAWESLPYEGISPGPHAAGTRAEAAYRLRRAQGALVVAAPVLAVLQGLSPNLGRHEPLVLRPGFSFPPDQLAERLAVDLGYSRVDVVEWGFADLIGGENERRRAS